MARILVIGQGTLGRAVMASKWIKAHESFIASRSVKSPYTLDISNQKTVQDFFDTNGRFDIVVNCAAESNVDICEKDPKRARAVNALGVKYLADQCRAHAMALLHVSTDYVFGGDHDGLRLENDSTSPASIYGMTKLEGEHYALTRAPYVVLGRTTWIFGAIRKDFVNYILEELEAGKDLNVVADQKASPAYSKDLAQSFGEIVERVLQPALQDQKKISKIYHISNAGYATRFKMAQHMRDTLGLKNPMTKASALDFKSWKAVRPKNTALSMYMVKKDVDIELRPWQDALSEYVLEKRSK